MYTLTQFMIDNLIKTAKLKLSSEEEDFNAYDASGGNFDDAYSIGVDDGTIIMAREVLDDLKIEY